MYRIAKFEKVTFEQYKKDFLDCFDEGFLVDLGLLPFRLTSHDPCAVEEAIKKIYNNIKMPKRATKGSAGYDMFLPYNITIKTNETIKIPTGIRVKMEKGWVLKEYPRSGHGFKFGIHLANTVGIIDSDYYYSDNEGHILMKIVNDSILAKDINLSAGTAFCQGIFIPFGITIDDNTIEIRNGGFGSTSK